MEHWFDQLSRPHSRRTVLKTAVGLGVAALLPNVRLPVARAASSEPCFKACNAAARQKWVSEEDHCGAVVYGKGAASFLFGAYYSLLGLLAAAEGLDCNSRAELQWHRDSRACEKPECGDPGTYPGGKVKKPPPKCTPGEEFQCNDMCCNLVTDCCQGKSGDFACCARVPGRPRCGCAS